MTKMEETGYKRYKFLFSPCLLNKHFLKSLYEEHIKYDHLHTSQHRNLKNLSIAKNSKFYLPRKGFHKIFFFHFLKLFFLF